MKKLALIITAVVLFGCTPPNADLAIKTINDAAVTAKQDIATAIMDINAAMARADVAGKKELTQAVAALDDGNAHVDKIPGAVVSVTDVTKYWQNRATADESTVGFIVGRFIRNLSLFVLIPGLLLFFVVMPVLTSLFGASTGPIGVFLRFWHSTAPLQNVHNLINAIMSKRPAMISSDQILVSKIPPVKILNASAGTTTT